MGRVSVTISYSSRCLITETIKYINENSFIENLAASKKARVCGTQRQPNVIKIINADFACSEEVSCPVMQKCNQACVSKLLNANK